MHRLKEIALVMKAAILRGDLNRMAALLQESWDAKKGTSQNVSNPLIERLSEVGHKTERKLPKFPVRAGAGL